MSILFPSRDNPFEDIETKKQVSIVHIRIRQRNGRKTVTTVEGIGEEFDLPKITQYIRRMLSCIGTVIDTEDKATGREYQVMQFSGDHREQIRQFLLEEGICDEVKIHGF